MGRIVPPFRELHQETVSDFQSRTFVDYATTYKYDKCHCIVREMSDKSFEAKRTITFSISVIAALSLFLAASPIVTNQKVARK
jgi:hypothetical protein